MSIQIVTINNVLPFEDVQRCQHVDMTVTLERAVAVLDWDVTAETGTAAETLTHLVSLSIVFFSHVRNYRPQHLRKGNVFTSVCHSVHQGVGVRGEVGHVWQRQACMAGACVAGRHAWEGA